MRQCRIELTGIFCTSWSERESHSAPLFMSIQRYKPEQIVNLLRQSEMEITNGMDGSSIFPVVHG